MASFSVMEDFEIIKNDSFLEKADQAKTPFFHEKRIPLNIFKLKDKGFGRGDRITLDMGEHLVGHITFSLGFTGSHPDAPLYLRLRFAEHESELQSSMETYDGWLSKSWIQEEMIHVDILPACVTLPRRYAFRYVEITVLDTSQKYKVIFEDISVDAITSANAENICKRDFGETILNEIDQAGIRTLRDCMQDVFEDGPKRDRRLWLGDLRLQALTNYMTFKNYDLVKRCLYLFAGLSFNEGKISACLFTEPTYEPDDTYLVDYALLYVPTLWEYYQASNDKETLKELYATAQKQINLVSATRDKEELLEDQGEKFWCFLDWGNGLNKHAGANAVLLYTLNYGIRMAEVLEDMQRVQELSDLQKNLKASILEKFWDNERKLFVSGPESQISMASQIWMILAGAVSESEGADILERAMKNPDTVQMQTPYIYHYYVTALIQCGNADEAKSVIRDYWGGMINAGADTFWEVFDPKNPDFSPYGSAALNSFCHAWSCTPTYLLRTVFGGKE
ncbi:MAG: sugar hydrolase [Eubacteriales bacterium]|nr:sugar hydrolase [Eubacteriales bacterium]